MSTATLRSRADPTDAEAAGGPAISAIPATPHSPEHAVRGGDVRLSRRSRDLGGAPNSGNSRNSRATPENARSEPPNGAVPGPTGAKRRDRAACLRDTVRGRPAGYTSTSTTVLPEPRAAPAAIVRRLNAATLKAMADDLVLLLDAQGFVLARPRTLEETASQTREHSARWTEVIRAAGIRL